MAAPYRRNTTANAPRAQAANPTDNQKILALSSRGPPNRAKCYGTLFIFFYFGRETRQNLRLDFRAEQGGFWFSRCLITQYRQVFGDVSIHLAEILRIRFLYFKKSIIRFCWIFFEVSTIKI